MGGGGDGNVVVDFDLALGGKLATVVNLGLEDGLSVQWENSTKDKSGLGAWGLVTDLGGNWVFVDLGGNGEDDTAKLFEILAKSVVGKDQVVIWLGQGDPSVVSEDNLVGEVNAE